MPEAPPPAHLLEGSPASAQPTSASPPPENLQRRLTQRQLTMLALGGAIGVGLFLGSSITIGLLDRE